jgi:hypothetical protein
MRQTRKEVAETSCSGYEWIRSTLFINSRNMKYIFIQNMLNDLWATVRSSLLQRLMFICANTPHDVLLCVLTFCFYSQQPKMPRYCIHSDFLCHMISEVSFSAHYTEVTGKLHTSADLVIKTKSSHGSLERKLGGCQA